MIPIKAIRRLFSSSESDLIATIRWLGQDSNRRMVTGVIVGLATLVLHQEVDSTLVDGMLFVLSTALLAKWSSHHPAILVEATGSDKDD